MPNDHDPDEALFRGFDLFAPAPAASRRAVEETRRLLLAPSRRRTQRIPARIGLRCGLAAAALLTAVAGAYLATTRNPGDTGVAANESPQSRRPQEPAPGGKPASPDIASSFPAGETPDMAAKIAARVHAISAAEAPVIAANGGMAPIRLGSAMSDGGGLLHVWDWSEGPLSRIVPGVEFWGTETVALTPDGQKLVWARGDIVDLPTGERTRIDLGGAEVRIGAAAYQRIGDMQFSPDGGRLALLVTNFVEGQPGRIESEVVQVVAFPAGRRLCEFPAGESYALRIGFSADGSRIAAADPGRHVLLREAATGEIVQRFASAVNSQVLRIAVSPDGKHVAALGREPGELFLWEAESGRLAHRIGGEGHPTYGTLRFSPDSRYLAADMGDMGDAIVVQVRTGEVIATLDSAWPVNIQWSDDGERLAIVSPVLVGGGGFSGRRRDRYPEVSLWDWRNGRRIPTFGDKTR